ncbi:MAG: hypothetical protein COB78_01375 [Hyphomicrobiales bacterium]|nr:MAG: hypothetical protein COB78_01375 [Hyphomicrobiales bacterium]
MRVSDRQQGLLGGEDFSEANAEQNARTDANESSSKSDTLFEFENDQSENHSSDNEPYFGSSIANVNWTPEGVPIGQISLEETLEGELTSGVLENHSLSYIKSKANKLENAIREVNRECDNLIAVRNTPGEEAAQLNAGMLPPPRTNSTNTTSKRMLVMASVALLATCGGVYAYVSPENPIKLAVHSKIVELVNQPITETIITPSKNVYASLGGFMPPSQTLTTQVEEVAKPSSEQTPPVATSGNLQRDTATTAVPVSKLAEVKIANAPANAPIVREIIPQARQSRTSQFEISQIKISQTSATDSVGLSERFGKGVTLRAIQPASPTMHNTNASGTNGEAQGTSPRLVAFPKEELKLQVSAPINPPKKRDRKVVERLVLQANEVPTLDNSQFKILVARLAQGDCLSSALHGIFGESKISPLFVRTILTDIENGC